MPPNPILIVEDDDDIRDALADALELAGYRVVSARHGQAALDWLRHSPQPRLILLDLMMPVMDGWQFRREQLKSPELARIPVIVFSACMSPLPTAVDGYLKKPVDTDHLLSLVSRYVCDK